MPSYKLPVFDLKKEAEAAWRLAEVTGFSGHKLRVDDMVQLAVKLPCRPVEPEWCLAPRVYIISDFIPVSDRPLMLRVKLSTGWTCDPGALVRADRGEETTLERYSRLRFPTPWESTFRMEPMLNDNELGLLQLLREKPGKGATLKNPANEMPDMYKHLVQRGYCRVTEALVGPLRVKTGEFMILLTEAGEIAMTAQLLTSSKDMESRATYECPNGHQMIKFYNGQPMCSTCAAEMKRIE